MKKTFRLPYIPSDKLGEFLEIIESIGYTDASLCLVEDFQGSNTRVLAISATLFDAHNEGDAEYAFGLEVGKYVYKLKKGIK